MSYRPIVSLACLAVGALLLSSCGKPDAMGDESGSAGSSPYPGFHGQDTQGDKNFANLINNFAQGRPERTPWAGYWWPYTENGIASGTYGSGESPAAKYDAARGRQTNARGWEIKEHGKDLKDVQGWWGHCNGWSAAAALFPEPREPAKVNGIEFGVADIKALLSEAAMEVSADFYGERVDFGNDYNSPKYTDTVPDQYFLVLTNYMGRLKKDVLMDRYTGDQVWNHPIVGYRFQYPKPSDYLGAHPQKPGVYRIEVTSTIWWVNDGVEPSVLTPTFDFPAFDSDIFQQRTLRMEVWLDGPVVFGADGKITSSGDVVVAREGMFFAGGAWTTGDLNDAWPDYMWVPFSVAKSTGYANPDVSIEWLQKHLLVPGGADDPTATPRPVEPAPSPSPRPTSTSSPEPRPTPTPVPFPTTIPTPEPRPTSGPTFTPVPDPVPDPEPQPEPTTRPRPWPWPFPRPS